MPEPFSQQDIQPFHVWTLDKGLFADRHGLDVPPQGCQACKNLINLNGFLRPRPGLFEAADFVTGSATPVYHLAQYQPALTYPRLLHATRNGAGDVEVFDANPTWGSIGTIAGGAAADRAASSVNFKGEWIYAPGNADLYYYNGGTFATIDSRQADTSLQPPNKPYYLAANDARVFMANVEDSLGQRVPYRIAWCDMLNVNIWNGGFGAGSSGFVDLAGESDPITALYATSDIVVVFKPRTIYIGSFVGPPQFYAFRRLVRGPGCISASTLKEYRDGLLVWLGDDNVYMGLPGQRPEPIGDAIEDRIREVVSLTDMSKARAIVDRDNHLYTLFLPSGVAGGFDEDKVLRTFTCNLRTRAWWEGLIQNPDCEVLDAFTYRSAAWTERLLIGSQSGAIYEQLMNIYQDDGSDFETFFTTKIFNGEQLFGNKTQQADVQLLRIHALPAPQPVTSSPSTSGIDFYHTWGNGFDRFTEENMGRQTVDGSSNLYVPMRRTSEHFYVKMYNAVARNQPFIAGMGFGIIPEADTRYRR